MNCTWRRKERKQSSRISSALCWSPEQIVVLCKVRTAWKGGNNDNNNRHHHLVLRCERIRLKGQCGIHSRCETGKGFINSGKSGLSLDFNVRMILKLMGMDEEGPLERDGRQKRDQILGQLQLLRDSPRGH